MKRFKVLRRGGHALIQAIVLTMAMGMPVVRSHGQSAAALEAENERASFRVLEGFEVSLFATEEEGALKPIQIRFDPEGRLWLVGSTVYPQITPGQAPNDRVTMIEDTDRDGRADRHTVFADGLLIPTGIELGDGGVYVGAATELLHFRDTDQDGRADQRRVVFRGFGTGDTHQTLNSFTWGPSGELMMSQGLHANSRIETPWGLVELRQSGVWRLWTRRLKLEAFWSGAMGSHNPFGTVFDRWGQPIIFAGNGHGVYHLTQGMIETDHFLEHRWLWNEGRKFGGGEQVENSHWPDKHQGEFITGGYLHNTVERFRLTDAGSSFSVERLPPLIESTNTAFRIVDVRFGPDGALYLCDWHNPVIGHYQASFRDPARDRTKGRIWRVAAKGRPRVNWSGLSALSEDELLNLLESGERWNRQMAKRVLAERPSEAVAQAFSKWLPSRMAESRRGDLRTELALVEALGVHVSLGILNPNLLSRVAHSEIAEARAYAARVTGHWAGEWAGALKQLEELIADRHPRVRLEAVVACSYFRDPAAIEVAAHVADQPMDGPLEYAFTQAVHALRPIWEPRRDSGALGFEGWANRLAAFNKAARGLDSARFAAGRLRRVREVALDVQTIQDLAGIIVEEGGTDELPALLPARGFTVGDTYHGELHATVLERAAQASRQRGIQPDANQASGLKPLLEGGEPRIAAAAARLAGAWKASRFQSLLAERVADPSQPEELRQGFVEGLGGYDDDSTRELLRNLAAMDPSRRIRAGAIGALAGSNPGAAAELAAQLFTEGMDEDLVRSLMDPFLRQREGPARLKEAWARQSPAPENARIAIIAFAESGRADPEILSLLRHASGEANPIPQTGDTDRQVLLEEVRTHGAPNRGEEVFRREALGCARCHAVDGTQGKIGPDLGSLGTAQTLEFIYGALVDPQREVKEGFFAHEVETADGDFYQGYVRSETESEVALWDHLRGETVRLGADRILERRPLGSLMPAGLADSLTREELRDLLAYLANLGRRDSR